jgi:DNA mismatch repair protein MutS2
MDARVFRILEYEKVRELVRGYAASSLGREIITRMKPVQDDRLIHQRLTETTEARTVLAQATPPFQGLKDVRDALQRAQKEGVLTPQDLLDVGDVAACSRRLRRALSGHAENAPWPHLRAQANLLCEQQDLETAIDRAIAPTGEVLDTASQELDRARRRVRGLHDDIQRTLQRLVTSVATQEMLQDPIITERNGRSCLPVKAEYRHAFKGIVHDLSASGQTAFMEPLPVVELGNDLREAERIEQMEVLRVLTTLSLLVGRYATPLLTALDAAARLDAIFARASFARATDAVEPEVADDGPLRLLGARHPLLGADAVPIDLTLGEQGETALLITGPNTGGKTVTLKTIGLFLLMAQSGLHVPAAPGTRLPRVEQVFADIGDEQSIEQSLSTFSGHMMNIVRVVKEAGKRALVLLDEVGAGTDPAEGAALAKAILLELQSRGCRIVATTHYGELKAFAQVTPGFANASVEFDMETLRPTYRVITGLPGSSNALAIAQRLGLPKAIVARAREQMGEGAQAMEQVLKQAEAVRRALDRERTAAEVARRQSEATSARLARDKQELDERRTAALAKAREEATAVVQRARQESGALLEDLRAAVRQQRAPETPAQDNTAGLTKARRATKDVLGGLEATLRELPAAPAPPPQNEKPTLARVVAGQEVLVRSVNARGLVLQPGHGDDVVEVQVGIMKVRVPLSDLEDAPRAARPTPAVSAVAAKQPNPELYLLGQRADEATERVTDYLDLAAKTGLTRVRIVHGHGTGALRSVVKRVLEGHPAVTSFRTGERNEGGAGVTIAEVSWVGGN